MWCHLRVPLSLSCHPFSSQGSGEQSQEIGGDSPSLPPVAWGVAVFISGCVRAGTEAWPRISVYKVLRVVPRTDTQGEVFLLPSPPFPGHWAGPRPPVHKETCGGGPGGRRFQAGGHARCREGRCGNRPVFPPPSRPPAKAVLFFAFTGTLAGEGRRRGCGAPRAAGMSWRDQVLLLWELEEALPGQCRWEGWGLVRNGVSGSI